jgi:hypothetical protein
VFLRSCCRAALLGVTCLAAACAPKLMKLPQGPGTPATDVADAFTEATRVCAGVRTLSAEIGVSGSIAGNGMRGRLIAGVAAPASARIEAVAPFGQPVFIFAARGDDATLLLPRDERILEHGKPDAVLEAVAGVPLDPADLRRALTGCPSSASPPPGSGARPGKDDWRIVQDGTESVYLHRDRHNSPWYVAAIVHRLANQAEWRAEYREHQNGAPRAVRLVSGDRKRFDLRLTLSQVEINTELGDDVFRIQAPRSASPITLEELRASGPLREKR